MNNVICIIAFNQQQHPHNNRWFEGMLWQTEGAAVGGQKCASAEGSFYDSCFRIAKITIREKIAPGYKYQNETEPRQHLYEYYKDIDITGVFSAQQSSNC